MANINTLNTLYAENDKQGFNKVLVDFFEKDCERKIDVCVTALNDAGIALKRAQVIGKLSICGVKNIVPKVDKPKAVKDNGPTKKELIAELAKALDIGVTDILTFNNVKKSEIATVIKAVKTLTE